MKAVKPRWNGVRSIGVDGIGIDRLARDAAAWKSAAWKSAAPVSVVPVAPIATAAVSSTPVTSSAAAPVSTTVRREANAGESEAEIETCERSAPVLVRSRVRSEGELPFAVRSNGWTPLVDAMIVVCRLANLDRAAVVRVAAGDASRLIDQRWRFDLSVLIDPLASGRRVRVATGKRQPVDGVGTRAAGGLRAKKADRPQTKRS